MWRGWAMMWQNASELLPETQICHHRVGDRKFKSATCRNGRWKTLAPDSNGDVALR